MISVVVLQPESFPGAAAGRELVVRSLAWLVGAAVAGVVGDVVLATSSGLRLREVADAVGSGLIESGDEGSRLRAAADTVRFGTTLVIVAGYAPDAALIDEMARRPDRPARLLAEPASALQRLWPSRAPVVGLLAGVADVRAASDFRALDRAHRRAAAFTARARSLS